MTENVHNGLKCGGAQVKVWCARNLEAHGAVLATVTVL